MRNGCLLERVHPKKLNNQTARLFYETSELFMLMILRVAITLLMRFSRNYDLRIPHS